MDLKTQNRNYMKRVNGELTVFINFNTENLFDIY